MKKRPLQKRKPYCKGLFCRSEALCEKTVKKWIFAVRFVMIQVPGGDYYGYSKSFDGR